MVEKLFISSSELEQDLTITRRPRKGVIIGAGQVGMACAYSILIQLCHKNPIIYCVPLHFVL